MQYLHPIVCCTPADVPARQKSCTTGRLQKTAHEAWDVRLKVLDNAAAGASETEELYHVLTSCMMVRRLKKDVLSQLPPKRRTQVGGPLPSACHQS